MKPQAIDPRMIKARTSLIHRHPFWGSLALHLQIVEDPSVETMAVDGKHLFYAPKFLDTLTQAQIEAVIAHEVCHCAYKHHVRRGSRDFELWNEACDHPINLDLQRAGFDLPKPNLCDPQYDRMSAEEVFAIIAKKQAEQQKQQGQGQGQGQGAAGSPQPGGQQPGQSKPGQGQGQPGKGTIRGPAGMGKVLDAAPEHDQAATAKEEAEWDVLVRQALSVEAGRNAGKLPGNLARMAEAVKQRPVDWREVLHRFVDSRASWDYSWSHPNKRMLGGGIIFPGTEPDGIGKLAVVRDTSGSIDRRLAGRFNNELQAILDDGSVSEVVMIDCDASVRDVRHFQMGDQISMEVKGGGGTRFSPALEWLAQKETDIVAIIYLTDLDCRDFGPEPNVPTLWAAYGPKARNSVPFGEKIILI